MADKKKVYSLTINGLKESLDAAKALDEQLKDLDKTITSLKDRTIKVKGEVEVTNISEKTVVTGGKTSSAAGTTADKEKQLAVEKQITQEIKAQGQYQAALDEAYREGERTIKQTKEDTKNLLSGAINEAGEFTNTMAGWKAELKALKQEREGLDLTNPEDVERFRQIQERANSLTTILKTIESEAGNFSRNVGNYPQSVQNLNNELLKTQQTIKSIEDEMGRTATGDRFNKLSSELEITKKHAEDLKNQISQVGTEINNLPKVEVKVGDTVRQFSSMREAARQLREEYAQLVAQGKANTKEANDLAKAYGQVATATKNATGELASYIGNAKGLKDAVAILQGVASIGSIGAGLSGLFGGKNEELDKSLKTFTSLSMIMTGLSNLQKELNDKTSIWGVTLSYVWEKVDKVVNKFGEFTGLSSLFDKLGGNLAPLIKQLWRIEDVSKEFANLTVKTAGTNKYLAEQARLLQEAIFKAQDYRVAISECQDPSQLEDLNEELGIQEDKITACELTLKDYADAGNETAQKMLKLAETLKQDIKATSQLAAEGGKTSKQLLSIGKAGRVAAVGINLAATAIKTFAKATLVLGAFQILMEAVTWTLEKFGDALDVLRGKGGLDMSEQMQNISDTTELANKQLERYIEQIEYLKNLGVFSELDAQKLGFAAIAEQISIAGKELQEYIKLQDEIKAEPLKKNLNNSIIWGLDDAFGNKAIKNVQEFKKEYEILIKAVQAGTDKIEAGSTHGYGLLLTAGDAVEELGDKTKTILGDMQNEINKINFDNPEEAVKQCRKIMDNELYQSAITQMHTLFPEEEWAKALDRMYDRLAKFVDMSDKKAKDLAVAMKKANQQLEDQTELANINAIKDANKRQEALDEYNRKKRKREIDETVADEEHKEAAKAAVDAEYDTKAEERAKQRLQTVRAKSDEEYNIIKQIRNNLLELEVNNLDKQIKVLENAMDEELRTASRATKHREELIESIQKKYQKKIEDTRAEWFKKMIKQQRDFDREIIRQAQDTAQELEDVQRTSILNEINRQIDENENRNVTKKENISLETTNRIDMTFEDNEKNLKAQQEYYDKLLEEEQRYIAQKQKLELDAANAEEKQNKEQAKREYSQRLTQLHQWLETQTEALEQQKKDGLLTEDEYNKNLQKVGETFNKSQEDIQKTYQNKLSEITKNGEQERKNIITDSRREQQRVNNEANNNQIEAMRQYLDDLDRISEEQKQRNTNKTTGLFNIAKERERLNEVKKAYEDTLKAIEKAINDLKRQQDEGLITPEQAAETKKNLEAVGVEVKKDIEEVGEESKNLVEDWGKNLNAYAQQIASSLNQMVSSAMNIWSAILDGKQAQIDEEQKLLDKETDAVEKAYDKQAEIVQRYKDAINNTEDELKNARGERRLALLDSLAQQREGYLKETETLKEQELEKEKIEKKRQKLEKQQEELDKKRKQQQKIQSIIQATINTSLGITQALAAWPPPYSYILAAAVGAMGAAEIAVISSQKYAKGGLLQGNDHEHGGIKVPVKGGMAEVEGNEYIVNKKTTTENLSLIEFMNSKKRKLNLDDFVEFYSGKAHYTKADAGASLKFADGGELPDLTDFAALQQQTPIQLELNIDSKVAVTDIISAQDRVNQVKVLAGL